MPHMMMGGMKMANCRVKIYNVGQGLFSLLLEEREDGVFCALFDCGTSGRRNSELSKEALFTDAVGLIQQSKGLDYIVISHQDRDHWSYLLDLMRAVYGEKIGEEGQWQIRNGSLNYAVCNNSDSIEWCTKNDKGLLYSELNREGSKLSYVQDSKSVNYIAEFYVNKFYYKITCKETGADSNITVFIRDQKRNIKKVFGNQGIDQIGAAVAETCNAGEIGKVITGKARRTACSNLKKIYKMSDKKVESLIKNAKVLDPQYGGKQMKIIMGGAEGGYSYQLLKQKMASFGSVTERDSILLKMNIKGSTPISNLGIVADISKKAPWRADAIRKNATSVVVCYKTQDGNYLLFPGDATVHVFGSLSKKLGDVNCALMVAPHHGAYNTNYVLDADFNLSLTQPFWEMLDSIQPERVFISAYHTKHGHPCSQFVKDAEYYAVEVDEHPIGYCTDRNSINFGWEVKNSTKAVYTTETCGDLTWPVSGNTEVCRAGNDTSRTQRKLPPDGCFISRERVNV